MFKGRLFDDEENFKNDYLSEYSYSIKFLDGSEEAGEETAYTYEMLVVRLFEKYGSKSVTSLKIELMK